MPVGFVKSATSHCRGGVVFKLLVFLTVVAAFAALAWMTCLPLVLTYQVRSRTGFDAKVERFSFNPFTGEIDLRGLVVTNPPTFSTHDFIELREFQANARALSLFSDELVIDQMTIDLTHVTLVKREDGSTNAQLFEQQLNDAPHRLVRSKPSGRKIVVRHLELKIDHLTVADHSERRPNVKEYQLGIHQQYADVRELKQLLAPAVLQNLAPVAVAISGLIPGELGASLGEVTQSSADLLRRAGRKTEERVKGFFDALEESKKP